MPSTHRKYTTKRRQSRRLMRVAISSLLIASFITFLSSILFTSKGMDLVQWKINIAGYTHPENVVAEHIQKFALTVLPYNTPTGIEETAQVLGIEEISREQLAQSQNRGTPEYDMVAHDTTLSIKSVGIDGPVVQGDDSTAMSKGFWHFPLSVPPGTKGNTVIIGHRFDKLPPATDTFFNLDKVKVGDRIILHQDLGDTSYIVVDTKVVNKYDRSVLADTDDYRLTLITCHPLWTSKERLVIIAKMDKIGSSV